jgi:hypothetical protein
VLRWGARAPTSARVIVRADGRQVNVRRPEQTVARFDTEAGGTYEVVAG